MESLVEDLANFLQLISDIFVDCPPEVRSCLEQTTFNAKVGGADLVGTFDCGAKAEGEGGRATIGGVGDVMRSRSWTMPLWYSFNYAESVGFITKEVVALYMGTTW
eukprot:15331540-Ditylum_brightwellii.AAC.1